METTALCTEGRWVSVATRPAKSWMVRSGPVRSGKV